MKTGKIYKILSNSYYIKSEDEMIECKAKGKFKIDGTDLFVGDNIEFELTDNGKGIITKVIKRKNMLIRPTIANVDKLIILVSTKDPEPDYLLLDKEIIYCLQNDIEPIICISKIDKDKEKKYLKTKKIYSDIGYKVYEISAKDNIGIDELRKEFKNNICVFSGNSGVGKSTLVNYICNKKIMKEGNISQKLSRGKHTTRHAEIIEHDGYAIVDTPGFSMLDVIDVSKEELCKCFEEFIPYLDKCEFRDCTHIKEEKCGVKKGIEEGKISKERYDRYLIIYDELKENRRKR